MLKCSFIYVLNIWMRNIKRASVYMSDHTVYISTQQTTRPILCEHTYSTERNRIERASYSDAAVAVAVTAAHTRALIHMHTFEHTLDSTSNSCQQQQTLKYI